MKPTLKMKIHETVELHPGLAHAPGLLLIAVLVGELGHLRCNAIKTTDAALGYHDATLHLRFASSVAPVRSSSHRGGLSLEEPQRRTGDERMRIATTGGVALSQRKKATRNRPRAG